MHSFSLMIHETETSHFIFIGINIEECGNDSLSKSSSFADEMNRTCVVMSWRFVILSSLGLVNGRPLIEYWNFGLLDSQSVNLCTIMMTVFPHTNAPDTWANCGWPPLSSTYIQVDCESCQEATPFIAMRILLESCRTLSSLADIGVTISPSTDPKSFKGWTESISSLTASSLLHDG